MRFHLGLHLGRHALSQFLFFLLVCALSRWEQFAFVPVLETAGALSR